MANYTMQALAPENAGANALPVPQRLILEDAGGTPCCPAAPWCRAHSEAAGIAIVFYNKSLVTPEFIRESWTRKLVANDGQTERLLVGNLRVAAETVIGKLGRITIPTLVVWGRDDELVPMADGRDYAAKIPGATLVIISECGHAPSIGKPREFMYAVEAFIR